jgi:hypothetical protein
VEDVMRAAVHAWFALPRVQGVRLAIAPGRAEARALLGGDGSMHVDRSQSAAPSNELHSRLLLPRSYDGFLDGLGRRTRRNFRYYRRRFEAGRRSRATATWIRRRRHSRARWTLRPARPLML